MSDSTPKAAEGTWTLTAPDGRQWQAEHPLKCVRLEQQERVPPEVALARIVAMANEPDFAERHLQLAKFYVASNTDDLIDKMEHHITRLQDKLRQHEKPFTFAPQRVREG
jgi:hypothetical protein